MFSFQLALSESGIIFIYKRRQNNEQIFIYNKVFNHTPGRIHEQEKTLEIEFRIGNVY